MVLNDTLKMLFKRYGPKKMIQENAKKKIIIKWLIKRITQCLREVDGSVVLYHMQVLFNVLIYNQISLNYFLLAEDLTHLFTLRPSGQ